MSISILGVVLIAIGLCGLFFSEQIFIFAIAISAAFTTSAAITIGDYGIPPFPVLGSFATVIALLARGGGPKHRHPTVRLLTLLLVWTVLVTSVCPSIFKGLSIIAPAGGIDSFETDSVSLTYTPSMLAQIAYLACGVGTVLYFLQRSSISPSLITAPIACGSILSALRLVPGASGLLDPVFRNSVSAAYNEYDMRHPGIYSEPSFLGIFSVMALVFCVYRVGNSRGFERVVILISILCASLNLLASQSGVGALGLVLFVTLLLLYYSIRFILGHMKLHPAWTLAPIGLLLLVMIPNPVSSALWTVIEGKEGTDSLRNRLGSDLYSLDLVRETFGIGVGLGANRPSSFATLVLSNVGIVGFCLLGAAIVVAVVRARLRHEWRPAVVALLALILLKLIAEPALSTPMLWLLLSCCVFAGRDGSGDGAAISQESALESTPCS